MVSGQKITTGEKIAEAISPGWPVRAFRNVLESTKRFADCVSGQFAMAAAILLPVLAGITGGAMDMYIHQFQVTSLQNSADNAVLAAVREASLKGWNTQTAKAVADNYLTSTLASTGMNRASYKSIVTVDAGKRRVTVAVEQDDYGYFFLGYFKGSPQIRVSATAQASGSTNVCVIGLEKASSGTVSLQQGALLTASNCAVYSNSTSKVGLESSQDAVLSAKLACSSGGYLGSVKNYFHQPITDCPAINDPLASRPAPKFSTSCKFKALQIKNKNQSLSPGVYCNGVTIKANASVTLSSGIYVFKDGPLVISSNASLTGTGVGLYFTGTGAVFNASSNSIVDLVAPTSGSMAGLIIFQDRNNAEADFLIKSKKASNLLGTIYLPNGNFIVDTNNKIAEDSAYTAIVALRLLLRKKPNLVLNTDYDSTTVPVPDGVGPASGQPRLVH